MIQKKLARRCVPLMVLPLVGLLPARAQLLPEPQIPSTAAPLSFEAIFASTTPAPVTIKTADLKGEWRLTTIRSLNEFSPTLALLAQPAPRDKEAQRLERMREAFGAAPGAYVTQGQTVSGGGEVFLVAYKMRFDPAEIQKAISLAGEKEPADPAEDFATLLEKLARERPLDLTLINVKLLGELGGVRSFNAATQAAAIRAVVQGVLAEEAARLTTPPANLPPLPAGVRTTLPPAEIAAQNAASQANLKRLGMALQAYAAAHEASLPPMATPAQAKVALTPFAGTAPVWARPDSGEAYRPNPMLSGRKVGHITNANEFIAFFEANPAADGTRGVVFLDGNARRLTAAEWPKFQKASKLQ